jgi:hypothetical protein
MIVASSWFGRTVSKPPWTVKLRQSRQTFP